MANLNEAVDVLQRAFDVEALIRSAAIAIEASDAFERSEELGDALRLLRLAGDASAEVRHAIDGATCGGSRRLHGADG